ncbi:YncE family protein [Rhodococcus sp. NPDC049939]|uniref:YncE family protein n=1 Tax=Rhodococcus sp. NPDC049939 TaxID=3155511 RepID=UPI0033E75151
MPSSPGSIVVDPTTNFLYVGHTVQGRIAVVNKTTLATVATISIPDRPGGHHWLAGQLIDTPRTPDVMVISPATRTLYATTGGSEVVVVDLETNAFNSTIETGGSLKSIAIDPESGRVYAADSDGRIVVIDDRTHTVIGEIPIPPVDRSSPWDPEGVAVDPNTQLVYAVDSDGPTMWTLDPNQSTVVSSVAVGDQSQQVAVAVNPDTGIAYAANYFDGTLVSVDAVTRTPATTRAGLPPTDIAVDAAENFIYLGASNNESVAVVDGRSFALVTIFRTGSNPTGLAIDPNSRALFVIDGLDSTISRWDPTLSSAPEVSESSSTPDGTQDDFTQALSTFLPAGYDPALLIEALAENDYGTRTCSGLEEGARYQVSGSGQFLMYVYGRRIADSINSEEDLNTFFRIIVENYCPENLDLIPE